MFLLRLSLCSGHPPLRKIVNSMVIATISLLVAGVLAEFGAQLYFRVTKHVWYHSAETKTSSSDKPGELSESSLAVIHPYFGYVWSPATTVKSIVGSGRIHTMTSQNPLPDWTNYRPNNHGFWSPYDYPFPKKSPDDFIIAVLGGSVAQWFSLQGSQALINNLRTRRQFSNRRVTILNFAIGGMKQPQQVLILSYFLGLGQELDCVINIDGFNETALNMAENFPRGIDVTMPRSYPLCVSAMSNVSSPEMVFWRAQVVELRRRISWWKRIWTETNSAAVYYIARKRMNGLETRLNALEASPPPVGRNEKSAFFILGSEKGIEAESVLEKAADLWTRASILMNSMAREAGAIYIHVLQPNQYFSEHMFSHREKEIALSDQSPYRRFIGNGYRRLLARGSTLRNQGVNFVSAINIFDDTSEIVYADSCCHYNDFGNQILARFIANKIIEVVENSTQAP